MSSKIVDPKEASVRPFSWRSAGQEGPREQYGEQDLPAEPIAPRVFQARMAELERQWRSRLEEACEQTRRDAAAAAEARLRAEIERLQQQTAQALAELIPLRDRMRREAEQDLVRLSIEIARRILRREVSVDPEACLGIVKAALDKLDSRELHRIRCSAADATALSQALRRHGLPQQVEITPDPALPRGAVILDTLRGVLDASIETQLAEIERGFADLVERRRSP